MNNNEITSSTMSLSDFAKTLQEKEKNKPNCKLCNSKHRKEAETLASQGSNTMSILRFLERAGEQISYNAVSNHINYHFRTAESETDLKEYTELFDRWGVMSQADDVLITKYIRMLDMEVTFLASKNAKLDLAERRKNTELITKITSQIQQLKETSRSLRAEMRPVEIVFSSLNRIIEVKLKGAVNPEVKQALKEVIEQLTKEVGDMPIEGHKLEE